MDTATAPAPSCPPFPGVEIAAVADRDFFIPTLVMLSSARRSKSADSRYRIHFFSTTGLSVWEQEKLTALASADFEINIHAAELTEAEQVWDQHRCVPRISGATMVRLRLPELLPQVERLLYLDGDILVRGDLSPLYRQEMGGALLAGVEEMAGICRYHSRERLGTRHYINAGILLMNLTGLRQQRPFTPAALEAAMHNPKVVWMDQDIINLYCGHALHLLPPRFNAMESSLREIHGFSLAAVNEFYGTAHTSWAEWEEDAVLIHMAGHKKPWLFNNVLHSELWMEAYRQSPLAHLSLPRGTEPEELRATLHHLYGIHPREPQELRILLLGFLPFITIRRRRSKCSYHLFGTIPLFKTSERESGRRCHLLFGFIPLLSSRCTTC